MEAGVAKYDPNIMRHEAKERGFELAIGDTETITAIENHIEKNIGTGGTVFHEIVSDLVHIDVHMVPPSEKFPWNTLITSGMSTKAMTVPEGAEEYAFAELAILLPAHWKLDEASFKDENNYWPVRLLKTLARLPHEYDTWLGYGHTVPNGDPAVPYASNTPFTGAMLMPFPYAYPDFFRLKINEEKTITFYIVLPMLTEEMDYKLKNGADKLADNFNKNNALVVDNGRKSCRPKFLGLF
jgi:hypothetical protein